MRSDVKMMMSDDAALPNAGEKQAIAAAFGRAAKHYDKAAEFQRQVGHRLLSQLPAASVAGSQILDLGCGTGYFSDQLTQRGLRVCAADLSVSMLEQAQRRCGNRVQYLQADAEQLPLEVNQFDMAFSSLALQWCRDLSVPLRELKRVVKPGGRILFSTLADGSLAELKAAWQQVDQYQHVNQFLSPNEIKLALAQAGLPQADLEFSPVTMYYPSAMDLMKDLKGIGATHLQQGRQAGLAGRARLKALEGAYEAFRTPTGQLPATYQVCFGVILND